MNPEMNPPDLPKSENPLQDSTHKQHGPETPKSFSTEEHRLYNKVFDNQPKIKKKPYRKRSIRKTCEELVNSFYPETEVSYEALRLKLIASFDRCSHPTILSYLGRTETRQKQTIDHTVNYLKSGKTTEKKHTFIHRYPAKKGYLEVFGLATLHTDSKLGKTWFRLFHTKQVKLDSPLRNPPSESFALKESDAEFKEALAYAKQQVSAKCPNKNFSLVNSVSVGVDKKPVLQDNVNTSTSDGDRERVVKTKKIFKVSESNPENNNKTPVLSESNLSPEERRLFRALDSSCREAVQCE